MLTIQQIVGDWDYNLDVHEGPHVCELVTQAAFMRSVPHRATDASMAFRA